jgi:hypothetical protein
MLRRPGIIRDGLLAVPAAAALASGLPTSAPAARGAQASMQGATTATARPQYNTAHWAAGARNREEKRTCE